MPPDSSCIVTKDMSDSTSPCYLTAMENGQRDTIAMTRMFGSVLSVIGTTAIITSVVAKRQCCNPNVTPIFVLCIADLLLALTWLAGGGLWLRSVDSALSWCFTTSLLNIILECAAINLTAVYAIVAYSQATQKLYIHMIANPSRRAQLCRSLKTFLLYFMAWFLPLLLVMVPFGVIAHSTRFVADADDCTCWCLPIYGNVAPYVVPRTNETAKYVSDFGKFRLYTGLLLGTSYLLVFVLLVVIYSKTLRYVRDTREPARNIEDSLIASIYGAKRRVIYFIGAFIVCGFANFVLSYAFVIYDMLEIQRNNIQQNLILYPLPLVLLLLESLSVPLQGFLNAVVYGWTRQTFVRTLGNGGTFSFFRASGEHEDLQKANVEPEEDSEIEAEQVSVKV